MSRECHKCHSDRTKIQIIPFRYSNVDKNFYNRKIKVSNNKGPFTTVPGT